MSANRALIVARARGLTTRGAAAPTAEGAERSFDALVAALTPAERAEDPPAGSKHPSSPAQNDGPSGEPATVLRATLQVADEQGVRLAPADLQDLLSALQATLAAREQSAGEARRAHLHHFTHELRNKIYATTLAWSVVKKRQGAEEHEAAALVDRSLAGLPVFLDAALAGLAEERRPGAGEPVAIAELVEELALEVSPDAAARKLRFEVQPVSADLVAEADRTAVSDTLAGLLRGAIRGTREGGRVSLRALPAGSRVLIEVEDESGGLAAGNARAVLASAASRSAPGAPGRAARKACGELDVRDVPGKGCIVALSLPRAARA
jgi:signal transduction histidine kinase